MDNFFTHKDLDCVVDGLIDSYRQHGGINHIEGPNLPSKEAVREMVRVIESLLFPGFVESEVVNRLNIKHYVGTRVAWLHTRMINELVKSFLYMNRCEVSGESLMDGLEAQTKAAETVAKLCVALVSIRQVLAEDARAALAGDPAACSLADILLSYPGFHALAIHRVAHFLYLEGVPLIPRMMAELVHSQTGIDIHPGASIGRAFFIDHGTGVVIGETAVIGSNVKIYQGVTLGALSVPQTDHRVVRKQKRHPTIEDGVTIYAGATILGGDTVVGEGSIIGGNVWLTRSVPAKTKVLFEAPRLRYTAADGSLSSGHDLEERSAGAHHQVDALDAVAE